MATIDYCAGSAVIPSDSVGKVFIVKNRLDCYTTNLLSTDAARIIEIKAGWFVKEVWVKVIQKGTNTSAMESVGDVSTGTTAWIATDLAWGSAGTVGTVVHSVHATDTNAALNGYQYAAADYILVTPKTATYDGIVDVAILVVEPFA